MRQNHSNTIGLFGAEHVISSGTTTVNEKWYCMHLIVHAVVHAGVDIGGVVFVVSQRTFPSKVNSRTDHRTS